MNWPPSPFTMLLSRHTRRREFITLLGGAAARGRSRRARSSRRSAGDRASWAPGAPSAWPSVGLPLSGRGLSEAAMSRVETWRSNIAGRRAMRSICRLAAEFVRLKVAVIVTGGTAAALAAKEATGDDPHRLRVGDGPGRHRLLSPASLGRAATSPACRSNRLTLAASGSSSCASWCLSHAELAIIANVACSRRRDGDARDRRQRRARSGCKSPCSKFGERGHRCGLRDAQGRRGGALLVVVDPLRSLHRR